MSKKHMKNNEVDLDEITPNLVPPKEVLDKWKDMLEHPEMHDNDWKQLEENRIKDQQDRIAKLKQMIDTGLDKKGHKISSLDMHHLKLRYEELSGVKLK